MQSRLVRRACMYMGRGVHSFLHPNFSGFDHTHPCPFGLRFWSGTFPLGLLSLPAQGPPPGPVTRRDSRPLEDFLQVNSTCSPSFKLRKPSITSLLCWEKKSNYLFNSGRRLQLKKKKKMPAIHKGLYLSQEISSLLQTQSMEEVSFCSNFSVKKTKYIHLCGVD